MKIGSRPDSLDVEQLRELSTNVGYRMLAERLRDAAAHAMTNLSAAKTWDETRYLQGQIAALTMALGLPDLLVSELKSKLKNP